MKKKALLLLIICITLCLQGCNLPERHPIEDLQNILIAGIDMEDGNIILTVIADTIEQGATSSETQIGAELYMATGQSVFEAKRNLHEYSEKRLVWHHLKYIIIGEEAARQGIDTYLSFFCENDENRFSHRLIVTKGLSAIEFLQQTSTSEGGLDVYIDTLMDETQRTGKSSEITLLDYAITRERSWESLYIPVMTLIENPMAQTNDSDTQQSNQQERTDANKVLPMIEGYALFYDDYLVHYLDSDIARGINFIINQVQSAAFVVTDNKNKIVSLEIIQSKPSISPRYSEPLSAIIDIVVQANMVEYTENLDINKEYLTYLEQQLSQAIKQEIEQALAIIQKNRVDMIGMGDAFYHNNAQEWQNIKEDWLDLFSSIKIMVNVTSDIKCTYSLIDAVGK